MPQPTPNWITVSSSTVSSTSNSPTVDGLMVNDRITFGTSVALTSYLWTVPQRPPGSAALFLNPNASSATFIPDAPGLYQIGCHTGDTVLTIYLTVQGSAGSDDDKERINVRSWGVVPNDSSTAQQTLNTAALNAAGRLAKTSGRTLVLPAGVIYINGIWDIGEDTDVSADIIIWGSSHKAGTEIIGTGSGVAVARVNGETINFELRNVRFNANNERDMGLYVRGTFQNNGFISNLSCASPKTWGALTLAKGSSLIGCQLHNVDLAGQNAVWGLYSQDSGALQNTHWYGGRFASCGASANALYAINRGSGQPDIFFHGPAWEGNRGTAVYAQGGHHLIVDTGHVENNCQSDSGGYTQPEQKFAGYVMSWPMVTLASALGSQPAVTATGERSVGESYTSIEIAIVTGGTLGAMQWRWRTVTSGVAGSWSATVTSESGSATRLSATGYDVTFAAGTYTVDNTYTLSHPSIALTGVPSGTITTVDVECTTPGALGVAQVRYRVDAGGWTTVTTGTAVSLSNGLTLVCSSGTYATTHTYAFTKKTTACHVVFDGIRFGQTFQSHPNPRITGDYATIIELISTTNANTDTITGPSGQAAGSWLVFNGLYNEPTVSWPAMNKIIRMPEKWGTVTISGANTSTAYTFSGGSLADEPDNSYTLMLSLSSVTGTPASGSFSGYASAIATTGFTLNVPTAPGVGNSVTYVYTIKRPRL